MTIASLKIKSFIAAQILGGLSLLLILVFKLSSNSSGLQNCTWISDVTPDAVIRLGPVVGFNSQKGGLFYKGQKIMSFRHAQAMGYGSHVWSVHDEDTPNEVIVFSGNQVLRAMSSRIIPKHPEPRRVIIVGLGSSIWYGQNPNWRSDHELLAAGEGFWRVSKQCPSFVRMSEPYDD
jgi:hypothetical protein